MLYIKTLAFIASFQISINLVEGKGAVKYIKYFEHLNYDRFTVKEQHERVRRSTQNRPTNGHVILNFQSHGRDFNIRLVRDNTLFDKDFQLVNGDGKSLDTDISHIYHGNIWGKPKSLVHGSIIDGVFTGVIKDPDYGAYYVEHKEDFFGNKTYIAPHLGHSVIYHENEIDFPHMYGPHKTCGSSYSEIEKRMDAYTKSHPTEIPATEKLHRERRSTEGEKNTCRLRIQTDHMLWNEMGQSRDRILAKIADHVKALNDIYGATVFVTSSGEKIRNIGFIVQRMVIDETREGKFYSTSIGVEKYLDLASTGNYNDFCLAYMFTQRDFDNGVLGLAWVGGVGSSGGICDKNRQYDGKDGKSLNTGIVTFMNYGSTVPSRVSHITFAHEVGHNFGSPHDSGRECTPGEALLSSVGNYIMFASATSGQKQNNRVFSPCSIGNMSKVLESRRDICFKASNSPICGNAIIDEGEECDCGYEEECDEVGDSNCCYAADDKENGCKLKENVKCSITQGPCCEKGTCRFKSQDSVCSSESDCRQNQTCDGVSAQCPTAEPKKNGTTECNYGTQVCWGGECTGSICQKANMKECSCPTPTEGDKSVACHACCEPVDIPGECKSTGDKSYHTFFNSTPILLQPGSPCDNFQGYCDMFSKCRKVDADGPLSRLKKAILNPELYRTIREWIVQYWWAVALMCLAAIMLMIGFIKLCSVHTPTNNPKLPKHRQLPGAETLRRRRRSQQRRLNQPHRHEMREYRR